jgi:hypothetical protein
VNIPGQKTTPFSIHLYAEDGTEIENGATTSQRAVRAEVAFTEEIKAMSSAHVSVLVDGRPLSGIKVSALEGDKSRWNINLSNTAEKPGLHILTLNCVRLKDKNNAYCEGNIELQWTEQLNVEGHVELAVADESTGSIDKSSGDYSYGELTLTATPADGYEFGYWMEDGVKIEGAGATFTYLVEKASTQLTAVFVPVIYEISISYDEQQGVVTGMLGGLTTGYFKWHDVLTLEDAETFNNFSRVPFNYRIAYLRIKQGLGMCYAIGEKIDKFSLIQKTEPPKVDPPKPKTDTRRAWDGKSI